MCMRLWEVCTFRCLEVLFLLAKPNRFASRRLVACNLNELAEGKALTDGGIKLQCYVVVITQQAITNHEAKSGGSVTEIWKFARRNGSRGRITVYP